MSWKIAVLTGSRAEYGLLKNIIQKINDDKMLDLRIIVTGTHLEKSFGFTENEITGDGFKISYRVPMNLTSDSPDGILKSMTCELEGMQKVFSSENYDMLVVLGDRYELLAACECAMIYRIPIAHIHGGELTHGAIDDMVRHSITKMSSLHFTSTEKYRQRVIQMGEHPDTVFNTGAPGLENARHLTILSKSTLTERFGIKWKKPVVLVTFHPVTLENSTSADQFGSLLYVIDHHKEFEYIFTYANADTDGHVINQMIDQYCSNHDNCIQVKSMGQQGYLSTLSYAFFVIGNSSSGLIEVPSFHIPTINIGDRQGGRIRADSVIDCSNDEAAIEKAVQKASSEEFRNKCQKTINPYEGADTSHRIVEEIKKYLETHHSTSKDFYDLIS